MATRSTQEKAVDFDGAFDALKTIFGKHQRKLAVKVDTAKELTLTTRTPSPFKQHKGEPLFFASVRIGRAYVSFHLLALYMNPKLAKTVSPELKKRMQGKACFNFKAPPERALLAELKRLTDAGVKEWVVREWI
jgi:hypothetical protein